jgi:hypothetical protein
MIEALSKIKTTLQGPTKQPSNGAQYEIIIISKILDLLYN